MTRNEAREQKARFALTLEGYRIEKGYFSDLYHISSGESNEMVGIYATLRKAYSDLHRDAPCLI